MGLGRAIAVAALLASWLSVLLLLLLLLLGQLAFDLSSCSVDIVVSDLLPRLIIAWLLTMIPLSDTVLLSPPLDSARGGHVELELVGRLI